MMRINLRKFIVIGCCLGLLWLLVSYSSFIQMPASGSKHSLKDLENKIDELQEKLQYQISDSNNLLAKLRQQLKKTEKQKLDYQNSHEDDVDIQRRITNPILPILVIACDRVTVKRCLEKLVDYRPNKDTFPIIISQDCGHNATYQVIKSFTENDPSVTVVQQPDLSEIALPKEAVKFKGYYKISRHYRFALNHVFKTLKYNAVIIVEDDLDIAPDFYDYFLGTYPLLYKDRSIWCISAWNDNGKRQLIDSSRPELLHRTDFFPGLGWVLRRETWLQLEPKWPQAYFDDWLRDPENTQGRSCIRPEISRTYNFGKVGVSKGLFFDRHLKSMELNMDAVDFTKLNLTYLIKDIYDDQLTSLVYSLPEVLPEDVITGSLTHNTVRVTYTSAKTYQRAAKKMGLMDDFRSGIPRTAYRGIVTCFIRGRRVYLAPSEPWTHYDPHWGR